MNMPATGVANSFPCYSPFMSVRAKPPVRNATAWTSRNFRPRSVVRVSVNLGAVDPRRWQPGLLRPPAVAAAAAVAGVCNPGRSEDCIR